MTTIIRIKYAVRVTNNERSGDSETSDKEMLVNIDCPLKIILNYTRNAIGLDDTIEFDLCDEINCQLGRVSLFGPYASGLDVFQADLTYFIVICQRDANGQMTNFTPLLSGKAAKRCSDTLAKSFNSFKKNSSAKSASKRSNNTSRVTQL